jgi:nicotinamide riboside kinase
MRFGLPARPLVVAIVGAESTGKTVLAQALQARLVGVGLPAAWVDEALREFCDRHRRTPRKDEQALIAALQSRRIDAAAAAGPAVVVADTTALMTAIYSEQVFGDTSLYALAEAAHRRCDVTLVTALDLPWQADGLQRDGAHVREPVDRLLRAALQRMALPYSIVSGHGEARLDSAWRAVRRALAPAPAESDHDDGATARQRWRCERCGDADCERHLLLASLPRR